MHAMFYLYTGYKANEFDATCRGNGLRPTATCQSPAILTVCSEKEVSHPQETFERASDTRSLLLQSSRAILSLRPDS